MLIVTQFGHIWLFRVIVGLVAVGILWMFDRGDRPGIDRIVE
jgi:hypothetical protein